MGRKIEQGRKVGVFGDRDVCFQTPMGISWGEKCTSLLELKGNILSVLFYGFEPCSMRGFFFNI